MIMEIELQSQVLDAINYVLYDQLKFKGNRMDYYNALNLYMHQVGVAAVAPIAMECLCTYQVGTFHWLNLHMCAHTRDSDSVGECVWLQAGKG